MHLKCTSLVYNEFGYCEHPVKEFFSQKAALLIDIDIDEVGFQRESFKFKLQYVSLRLRVQNVVPAQPCVGKY